MTSEFDRRRSFLRAGLAAGSVGLAFPLVSEADEIIVVVVDDEGENATFRRYLFTLNGWNTFAQGYVIPYTVYAIAKRLRLLFSARYPDYDFHIATRQTVGAVGFFSIGNFLDANREISLTHLFAVFASNIGPGLVAGFGQELVQLELRKRGANTQVAKYLAGGLAAACVGLWTFFGVPSVVSAVERGLGWEKSASRRRRLHEYTDTQYIKVAAMLNNMEYKELGGYHATIKAFVPLDDELPSDTDALYQYLDEFRYWEERDINIVGAEQPEYICAITDTNLVNGMKVVLTNTRILTPDPNQLDLPLVPGKDL